MCFKPTKPSSEFRLSISNWLWYFGEKIFEKWLFLADKADVTLTMADEDLVDMMTGKLNPQKAFFKGKLKIKGNMGLAMKLQEFQKRAMSELKSKL